MEGKDTQQTRDTENVRRHTRTSIRSHMGAVFDKIPANRMGRAGIEPATLGLKVPCSTN
jgi:hypothetical protein